MPPGIKVKRGLSIDRPLLPDRVFFLFDQVQIDASRVEILRGFTQQMQSLHRALIGGFDNLLWRGPIFGAVLQNIWRKKIDLLPHNFYAVLRSFIVGA
jgi:hypothetical protein